MKYMVIIVIFIYGCCRDEKRRGWTCWGCCCWEIDDEKNICGDLFCDCRDEEFGWDWLWGRWETEVGKILEGPLQIP